MIRKFDNKHTGAFKRFPARRDDIHVRSNFIDLFGDNRLLLEAGVQFLNNLGQDPVGHDQLLLVLKIPTHFVPVIKGTFLLQGIEGLRNNEGKFSR